MTEPTQNDWNFKHIRAENEERASQLESAGSPQQLVSSLARVLYDSIHAKRIRLAIDSKENKFVECRAIVQFAVPPTCYDWFFNARTGYRAQFWISPAVGLAFNKTIVESLTDILARQLPSIVTARRIKVVLKNGSRAEKDTGAMNIARENFTRSLDPEASKIWICERLYSDAQSDSEAKYDEIGFALLSSAERGSKLHIPKWENAVSKTRQEGEGLRAPWASCLDDSWLDLKGGFVDATGNAAQIKSQKERAHQIHNCGWT